jgi:hypothetical protein
MCVCVCVCVCVQEGPDANQSAYVTQPCCVYMRLSLTRVRVRVRLCGSLLDKDKSGFISREELQRGLDLFLKAYGLSLSRAEVR